MECSVKSFGYDNKLKVPIPEELINKSIDNRFPFSAEFEFDKILDRKDILERVNPEPGGLCRDYCTIQGCI